MSYTNLHPFVKRLIWAVVVLVVVAAFAAITRSLLLLFLSPALAGWVLFPPSDEDFDRVDKELAEEAHEEDMNRVPRNLIPYMTDDDYYYGSSYHQGDDD